MPRRYEVLLLGRVMAVISDRGSAARSQSQGIIPARVPTHGRLKLFSSP